MYGIYNAETLEELVKTVHITHSRQSLIESYSQANQWQLMKHIHKCMEHVVFNTM